MADTLQQVYNHQGFLWIVGLMALACLFGRLLIIAEKSATKASPKPSRRWPR